MSQKWWNRKASTSNPIFFKREREKKKSNEKSQPFQYVICKIGAKGFLLKNAKAFCGDFCETPWLILLQFY